MYQKWPSKPAILSRVSPGHLYYLFLDISQHSFPKYIANKMQRFATHCRSSPQNARSGRSRLPFAGLLLVNLGFWIFRFSIIEIIVVCRIFLENLVVRYRGKNNKGVLDRPWTKRRVLMAFSSNLKLQFTVNPES